MVYLYPAACGWVEQAACDHCWCTCKVGSPLKCQRAVALRSELVDLTCPRWEKIEREFTVSTPRSLLHTVSLRRIIKRRDLLEIYRSSTVLSIQTI